MDKEKIMKSIEPYVSKGKIPCRKALEIAEKEGITPKALGDMLNELSIKVAGCQLGCFP